MDRNYTVYAHINKIDGKMYIGITCQKPEKRWRNGKGYTAGYLKSAINKYGWDNFDHEITATNLTEHEAKNFERVLITNLKTNDDNFGYNLTSGGDGSWGYVMPEESRHKISDANKGENHPLWGKHHSEETRNKMRGKRESMSGENHPLYHKKRDKETCQKISEVKKEKGNAKGAKNPNAKRIVCVTTNEIFDCIKDAGEKYFILENNITQCLRRKQKYSGIHPETKEKMVWMFYEDYIKQDIS